MLLQTLPASITALQSGRLSAQSPLSSALGVARQPQELFLHMVNATASRLLLNLGHRPRRHGCRTGARVDAGVDEPFNFCCRQPAALHWPTGPVQRVCPRLFLVRSTAMVPLGPTWSDPSTCPASRTCTGAETRHKAALGYACQICCHRRSRCRHRPLSSKGIRGQLSAATTTITCKSSLTTCSSYC